MKLFKSKWLRLLLASIILLSSAAVYIMREYNRKVPDIHTMKAAYTPSAEELFTAFSQNEKEASQKYLDKALVVRGKIKQFDKTEEGAVTIVLDVSSGMSSVRCSMDSAQVATLPDIPVGSPIAIKGICTGYTSDELLGSDVILSRCIINN